MYGTHDLWLVALSVGIAIFTACVALHIADIAQAVAKPQHRQLALLAGAVTLGGGIWAMHFIGMLAFSLDTEVQYHPGYTLLSLLPTLLATWLALQVLARPPIGPRQIVLSGVLVGCGIAAMHFCGIASIQKELQPPYDPLWALLATGIAITLSTLAFWIRFGLPMLLGNGRHAMDNTIVLSGSILGLGMASMHYLGMEATHFSTAQGFALNLVHHNGHAEALRIALATVLGTAVVAITSHLLVRYRKLYQQMQTSESLYASLLLNIPGLAYRRRLDNRQLTFISDGALALTGWSAQESMADGHDFWDQIHPEDVARVQQVLDQACATQDLYGVDYRLIHRDGGLRWITSRGSVVCDHQGTPRWFDGLLTDITQRIATEQALHASESQHYSLLHNIHGVASRREVAGLRKLVFVTDSIEQLTGWTAQQCLNEGHDFWDQIHPEDQERVKVAIHYSIEYSHLYAIEYRLVHRDGSVRWVLGRGGVVNDESGTPRWLDVLLTDITERKAVEQALHASESQFRSLLLHIPGLAFRRELNGARRILFVSDGVLALTGWTATEFLARQGEVLEHIHPMTGRKYRQMFAARGLQAPATKTNTACCTAMAASAGCFRMAGWCMTTAARRSGLTAC